MISNKQKHIQEKLLLEINEYINELTNEDYFKLNIKDALKLQVLPKLTAFVFENTKFEYMYFNKQDALFFVRLTHPETITYAIEELDHKTYKFTNEWEDDGKEGGIMFLTTSLLWIGRGLEFIKEDGSNYQQYKDRLFVNLLKLEIRLFEMFINLIINYIKTLENKSYLSLLEMDLKTIRFIRQQEKKEIKTEKNLLQGKKLNIAERYKILDDITEIDKLIRGLNILDREKYKLLSIILDCNPTNAKQVMNGNYPAKIKEDLINNYLKDLKK